MGAGTFPPLLFLPPPFFFLYLVLDGEVDKVGVDQDLVGRAQLGVPLEEQGGRHFLAVRRREREERQVVSGGRFFFSLSIRASAPSLPPNVHMADLLVLFFLLALAGGGGLFRGGPGGREGENIEV